MAADTHAGSGVILLRAQMSPVLSRKTSSPGRRRTSQPGADLTVQTGPPDIRWNPLATMGSVLASWTRPVTLFCITATCLGSNKTAGTGSEVPLSSRMSCPSGLIPVASWPTPSTGCRNIACRRLLVGVDFLLATVAMPGRDLDNGRDAESFRYLQRAQAITRPPAMK